MLSALVLGLLTMSSPWEAPVYGGVRFGYDVCALPDIDKDGVSDFAVSAPYQPTEGRPGGVVLLFSGATRKVIRKLTATTTAGFGGRMIVYDDLDADGIPDLLVGCIGTPRWQIVSTGTGKLLGSINPQAGEVSRSGLGFWALVPVGDLDGDSRSDFACGMQDGVIWISGTSKQTLRRTGSKERTEVLNALPDQDGDGVCEVVVFVHWWNENKQPTSRSEIHFSASDKVLVLELYSGSSQAVGDMDGDGTSDLIHGYIKGPEHCWPGVVSGKTGKILWPAGTQEPGRVVSHSELLGGEDLNGDDTFDLLISYDGFPAGHATAFCGATGKQLWRTEGALEGNWDTVMGTSMDWLPDQNGDGIRDILTGGCDSVFHGRTRRDGAVWILSGADGSVIWRARVDEVLPQ